MSLLSLIAGNTTAAEINPSLTFLSRTDDSVIDDLVKVKGELIYNGTPADFNGQALTLGAWVRFPYLKFSSNRVLGNDILIMSINRDINRYFTYGLVVALDPDTHTIKFNGHSSGFSAPIVTDVVVSENEWHYIAIALDNNSYSKDGATVRDIHLYLDGEEAGVYQVNMINWTAFIGSSISNLYFIFGGYGFTGALDDVHIFNRMLAHDEIIASMHDAAQSVDGLCGWYKFDEVSEGTTGQFDNLVSDNDVKAAYYVYTLNANNNATVGNVGAESKPNLEAMTEETQRTLASGGFEVNLPGASMFDGVAALVAVINDETIQLPATLALEANTLVYLLATPENRKVISSVKYKGKEIGNGGCFAIGENVSVEDIGISTSTLRTLTVDVPEDMCYTLTYDDNRTLCVDSLIAGHQFRFVIENAQYYNVESINFNGEDVEVDSSFAVSLVMPDADAVLKINATKRATHTINIRSLNDAIVAVTDGSTIYHNGDEVVEGTPLSVIVDLPDGFYIYEYRINGVGSQTPDFIMADDDMFICADVRENRDYNHALTFETNRNVYTASEDRLDIDDPLIDNSTLKTGKDAVFSTGLWVRQTERASGGNIIFQWAQQAITSMPYLALCTTSSGEISIVASLGNSSSTPNIIGFGRKLPLNEWHYIMLVANVAGGEFTAYLDDESLGSVYAEAVEPIGNAQLYFAAGALTYIGSLDEWHIYNRLLTAEEEQLAYADRPNDVDGMVAWYKFENATDRYYFDNLVDGGSQAVYNKLSGTGTSSGMVTSKTTASVPDISSITFENQRRTLSLPNFNVEISVNGDGLVEAYYGVDENNLPIGNPIREIEGVIPGKEIAIVMTPIGDLNVNAITINGSDVSLGDDVLKANSEGSYVMHITPKSSTSIGVIFGAKPTAIDAIKPDRGNDVEVYYDLSGRRIVKKPTLPGFYIVKRGGKLHKVLLTNKEII